MEDAIKIIQTVGFPIFCCVWYLLRIEKRLERVADQINRMVAVLSSREDRSDASTNNKESD